MDENGLLVVEESGISRVNSVLTGCEGCIYDTYEYTGRPVDGKLITCKSKAKCADGERYRKDPALAHKRHESESSIRRGYKAKQRYYYRYKGKTYNKHDLKGMLKISEYKIQTASHREKLGIERVDGDYKQSTRKSKKPKNKE